MTEIASLASRNLVGDLRKLSLPEVSLARPSRYGQKTAEGGGRKGKATVKEKRGDVRDE